MLGIIQGKQPPKVSVLGADPTRFLHRASTLNEIIPDGSMLRIQTSPVKVQREVIQPLPVVLSKGGAWARIGKRRQHVLCCMVHRANQITDVRSLSMIWGQSILGKPLVKQYETTQKAGVGRAMAHTRRWGPPVDKSIERLVGGTVSVVDEDFFKVVMILLLSS